MKSTSPFIDVSILSSMLVIHLPPSFLETNKLCHKALCAVISYLVLWSIVHFKKCPEYLTGVTASVFIPSMRFMLYSLVSRSFSCSNLFSFFFHFCFFGGIRFQYSQELEDVLNSNHSDSFLIWEFLP